MITSRPPRRTIQTSAIQGGTQDCAAHCASAARTAHSIRHGFRRYAPRDDTRLPKPHTFVVAAQHHPAGGTTIDYVELEAGRFEFIFMNPKIPITSSAERRCLNSSIGVAFGRERVSQLHTSLRLKAVLQLFHQTL